MKDIQIHQNQEKIKILELRRDYRLKVISLIFNLDCYMETSKWVYWKDKWYYLGSYGAMLTDCITPDGYRVDKDGIWIK